jgi:hypothetical protein
MLERLKRVRNGEGLKKETFGIGDCTDTGDSAQGKEWRGRKS